MACNVCVSFHSEATARTAELFVVTFLVQSLELGKFMGRAILRAADNTRLLARL